MEEGHDPGVLAYFAELYGADRASGYRRNTVSIAVIMD